MSVKKSSYRLRVFQSNDTPPVTTIVFNENEGEPLPTNSDGSAQQAIVDNDVVETAEVSPHVSTS